MRYWPIVLLLCWPAAAGAQPLADLPAIAVQGEATAEVAPDMARLSIGVVAERPIAGAATADVATAAQAMAAEVRAAEIDAADVATARISLVPVYADAPKPGAPAGPRAYRASTELMVTVRPAERAGTVAARLVDKGANTIDGIAYASSREEAVRDGLRAEAMHDARRKAQLYVEALGLKLGRVLEIAPSSGEARPAAMRKMMMDATPAVPVEPGTLSIRADVTVRWEIVQ